jgi:HSP20 family protein
MMKKNLILKSTILGLGTALLFAPPSFSEETVEELKAQVQALSQRVAELEAQQQPRLPAQQFQHRGWDPFAEMQRIQQEMDEMFSDAFSAPLSAPHGAFSADMVFDQEAQLKETETGYEVRFNMAGLDKDKIDVQINKHSITVSGQYSHEQREENPDAVIQSQRFGTFLKTIPLPVDADTGNVKTEQQGDDLVITLPKK